MFRPLLALALFLAACTNKDKDAEPAPVPDDLTPGAPKVGAAEGLLKLPVGTPLSGYTARCGCIGGFGEVDNRDSQYAHSFIESAGVHTTPTIKVIWIQNGDENLVLTKTDSIYSFDEIIDELVRQLEEKTGEELDGRVVHTTNHSHSSWGDYSKAKAFYLGSDKYNEEVFRRFTGQIVDVAMEAYGKRQDAKLGIGWAKDWDPSDEVYRDRRGVNDDLAVWDDVAPGMGKDPHLAIMRFDTLDDQPIAMTMTFGMHGVIEGEDNPLVSGDSGLGVEHAVQESLPPGTVVMFTQGAGGDASPAGRQDGFARHEAVGALAVDKVMDLYDRVPLSADPVSLYTVSRHIPQLPEQIHVTRDGTVDWKYLPYDEDYDPDDVIYDANGKILSPIDEFQTEYGAVFCGSGDFDFPIGKLESKVLPYSNCMEVELMSSLIVAFFDVAQEDMVLPLPETEKARITTSALGPIPTLLPDGTTVTQDLLMGFWPGETTAMFTEQWRRRVAAETPFNQPLSIGYAQDHEGYMLIPEDWLLGEYEADITFWGPLVSEYLMEQAIETTNECLTTGKKEFPDPEGKYGPTFYFDEPLPTAQPDLTPDAGTRLDEVPDFPDETDSTRPVFFVARGVVGDLSAKTTVPRVQGTVQLGWIGGDPAVDYPHVVLEREEPAGTWTAVTSRSGRTIDESFTDILVGHTPDPLYPADADQDHYWWAGWQAVGHDDDARRALPEGTYRLSAYGKSYKGGNETWPWDTTDYEVHGEPFTLTPGAVTVTLGEGILTLSLRGPSEGWRMIHLDGDSHGDNPVDGPVTVTCTDGGGVETATEVTPSAAGAVVTVPACAAGTVSVKVVDVHGNVGTYTF